MSYLRNLGYKLGKMQVTYPWFFVVLAIVITAATLPGIPILLSNVEPSLEKVLPQDLQEVKVMNDMRSMYGADMLYVVLQTELPQNDALDPDFLKYTQSLSQAIGTIDNVLEVNSIADYMKDSNSNLPLTTESAQSRFYTGPLAQMAQTFVNHDRSITIIQIKSDTGASAKTVEQVISDINVAISLTDSQNPGYKVMITGFNAIDNATFKVIVSDFMKITLISFAGMILFLLLHYKFSFKKTVYSLVIMILSLLWALGVTGYLGIKLNVVTMVSAAMIMALGSSYGINSVYHFYDDFLIQYDKKEAIPKFQEFLIIGLIGSALAEIAGFLALMFGIMPSMKDLGVILAIGISFALFVSVVILPVFFFLLEKGNKTKTR